VQQETAAAALQQTFISFLFDEICFAEHLKKQLCSRCAIIIFRHYYLYFPAFL